MNELWVYYAVMWLLPCDRFFIGGLCGVAYSLRSVRPLENYHYYFQLIKNKENPDNNENSGESNQELSQNDDIVTQETCIQPDNHNWQAGDDADEVTAVIRGFVNASTEIMDDEIRGLMPAHFLEQVKKINEPPIISWQKLLKKYVGTISAGKQKTRTRLNRRQPSRYDLSGDRSDKILKIVVAIDTSASVSANEISQIFNEIFCILSKRNYMITVIECDSEIQRVYSVRKPADVHLDVAGRGGTEFTPVIEYINADRYFRDSLLIYFTDGYGEDKIPKPMTYRNLWVITGSKTELSLRKPYGAVVGFQEGG